MKEVTNLKDRKGGLWEGLREKRWTYNLKIKEKRNPENWVLNRRKPPVGIV